MKTSITTLLFNLAAAVIVALALFTLPVHAGGGGGGGGGGGDDGGGGGGGGGFFGFDSLADMFDGGGSGGSGSNFCTCSNDEYNDRESSGYYSTMSSSERAEHRAREEYARQIDLVRGEDGYTGTIPADAMPSIEAMMADFATDAASLSPIAYSAMVDALVASGDTLGAAAALAARGEAQGRGGLTTGGIDVEPCKNGLGADLNVVVPTPSAGPIADDSSDDNDSSPSCVYFNADGVPGTLDLGGAYPAGKMVTLSWRMQGRPSPSLTLDGTPITGSRTDVFVTDTTQFDLVGTNSEGSDSCSVTVRMDFVPPVAPAEICDDVTALNYVNPVAEPAAAINNAICTYECCQDSSANNSSSCDVRNDLLCTYDTGNDPQILPPTIWSLADVPDAVYTSVSPRFVPAGADIYLRWAAFQDNGNPADECVAMPTGSVTHDFMSNTDPSRNNVAIGSFEDGDGQGSPEPGLADGESRQYSIRCSNAFDADTTTVFLTGTDSFGSNAPLIPPTLLVNSRSDNEVFARQGDDVEIRWDPSGSVVDAAPGECLLSPDVSGGSNLDEAGSVNVKVVGETRYTYSCPGGSVSIVVNSIPETQEI